eukprot:713291-Alexandrium_andersonii.AAC.1
MGFVRDSLLGVAWRGVRSNTDGNTCAPFASGTMHAMAHPKCRWHGGWDALCCLRLPSRTA